MQSATVSTDGSCLAPGNEGTGPTGWAWVLQTETISEPLPQNCPTENSGGFETGTNNIGELTAVLEALKQFAPKTPCAVRKLTIESDSQYVLNSLEKWMPNWKAKGWIGSNRKPVKNQELLKEIDSELEKRKNAGGEVEYVWVKGHAGNKYNEKVDFLARSAAESHRK